VEIQGSWQRGFVSVVFYPFEGGCVTSSGGFVESHRPPQAAAPFGYLRLPEVMTGGQTLPAIHVRGRSWDDTVRAFGWTLFGSKQAGQVASGLNGARGLGGGISCLGQRTV
jgi:hypothetical protein